MTLTLTYSRDGRAKGTLTALDAGAPVLVERVDLADSSARVAVREKILQRHPEIEPARIDAELLRVVHCAESDQPEHTEDAGDAKTKKNQSTKLVDLALESRAEFWHTPAGDGFASIPIDQHREHVLLRSKSFRRWLSRQYYLANDSASSRRCPRSGRTRTD
jgi:hypothetical protein